MRSAHRILAALFPEQPDYLAAIDQILTRLEAGLPTRALPLLELPVPLTRGQNLALVEVGALDSAAVLALPDAVLAERLGKATAERLKALSASTP